VLIMGVISVFVGRVLSFNEKSYSSTDQLTQVQQDLRAVSDLLERDLRHAGMLVPDDLAICGVDAVDGPDILYVSDALAIDPDDDFTTYGGIDVTSGDATSLGTTALDVSSLIIETSPPSRPAYDADGDGANDSDFQVGGGIIIVDSANLDRGVACGTVDAINVGSETLTVTVRSTLATSANLIAVPAHEYRVSGTQLLWNGSVVADGIEDLQVVYIVDNDDDDQVDTPQEIFGDDENAAHNLFNSNTPNYGSGTISISTSESVAALMREVQVSIVARVRLEDEDYSAGLPQATGNRDLSGATADGFRRRVVTTKVMLRNVDIKI